LNKLNTGRKWDN